MKLRYFFLALALLVIGVVSIAGFRGGHSPRPPMEILPDMIYQDKVKDQLPSAFFSDGNSARPPIDGTVALEMPARNDYWSTGKWDDTHWGDGIPVHDARDGGRPLAIDAANLARGRERYTITCSVCHGAVGDGKGITSRYGMNATASYQTDRIRNMNDGEIFNTITNGKGQMFGLGYNISIDDRWRIIMYLRALQHSQNASIDDASPGEQKQLNARAKPAGSASNAPAQSAGVAGHGTDGSNGTNFRPSAACLRPLRNPFFSRQSVILSLSKDQFRMPFPRGTELILRQAHDDEIRKEQFSRGLKLSGTLIPDAQYPQMS